MKAPQRTLFGGHSRLSNVSMSPRRLWPHCGSVPVKSAFSHQKKRSCILFSVSLWDSHRRTPGAPRFLTLPGAEKGGPTGPALPPAGAHPCLQGGEAVCVRRRVGEGPSPPPTPTGSASPPGPLQVGLRAPRAARPRRPVGRAARRAWAVVGESHPCTHLSQTRQPHLGTRPARHHPSWYSGPQAPPRPCPPEPSLHGHGAPTARRRGHPAQSPPATSWSQPSSPCRPPPAPGPLARCSGRVPAWGLCTCPPPPSAGHVIAWSERKGPLFKGWEEFQDAPPGAPPGFSALTPLLCGLSEPRRLGALSAAAWCPARLAGGLRAAFWVGLLPPSLPLSSSGWPTSPVHPGAALACTLEIPLTLAVDQLFSGRGQRTLTLAPICRPDAEPGTR